MATWKQLAALPDREGFAGAFGGVINGSLIVAGGANFPDKKPWDGGKKVWYDTVFLLENPSAQWTVAGRLPGARGYGVSVTSRNQLVAVGGSDSNRHHSEVLQFTWSNSKLTFQHLAPMPIPIANACGAVVGDRIVIVGGQERPDSTPMRSAWQLPLDSSQPKWAPLPEIPGRGRILAMAACVGDSVYVVGGVNLVNGQREYLRDAYRYSAGRWTRIADLPTPLAAAATPAPANAKSFWILGGDDGTQLGVSHDRHRGFTKTILRYDIPNDRWSTDGDIPAPRVTVPCIHWNRSWIVASGESRPGIRSPQVWSFLPSE